MQLSRDIKCVLSNNVDPDDQYYYFYYIYYIFTYYKYCYTVLLDIVNVVLPKC